MDLGHMSGMHAHITYFHIQGSVPVQSFDKAVLLIGRENMNRAVQGDVVAVGIFPEAEWKAPADEVVDQECEYRGFVVIRLCLTPSCQLLSRTTTRTILTRKFLTMKRG